MPTENYLILSLGGPYPWGEVSQRPCGGKRRQVFLLRFLLKRLKKKKPQRVSKAFVTVSEFLIAMYKKVHTAQRTYFPGLPGNYFILLVGAVYP